MVIGGGFALAELLAPSAGISATVNGQAAAPLRSHPVTDDTLWLIIAGAAAVWIAWSLLFLLISQKTDPARLSQTLHRLLITGSILELVIAVPSHIIVRRRQECCAGMLTGIGICLGVAIALVSFGPAVLLLYYRRFKRIEPRRASD